MPCRPICSRFGLELEQVDGSAARALCEGRFLYREFARDPSGGEGFRAAPFLLCREGRGALEIVARRNRESLHPLPKGLTTLSHLTHVKWRMVLGHPWSKV
jgi:hypothetical protein